MPGRWGAATRERAEASEGRHCPCEHLEGEGVGLHHRRVVAAGRALSRGRSERAGHRSSDNRRKGRPGVPRRERAHRSWRPPSRETRIAGCPPRLGALASSGERRCPTSGLRAARQLEGRVTPMPLLVAEIAEGISAPFSLKEGGGQRSSAGVGGTQHNARNRCAEGHFVAKYSESDASLVELISFDDEAAFALRTVRVGVPFHSWGCRRGTPGPLPRR